MPRKKRSLFGTEKRWKSRRGRETEEQRDRRLEMCRLRTGMSHERRTEKEVEMLERLETLLQSQVVDDEDDSSDGTESDEDEPVRTRANLVFSATFCILTFEHFVIRYV